MKKVLFFCCLLVAFKNYSQTNWQQFKKLSCPEKTWVIFHIFKAKKAFKVSQEALKIADSIAKTPLLDGDNIGGQLDAFKHAYWTARLREEIGKNAARSLGKAHERGNYQQFKRQQLEDNSLPDEISSTMDLHNNAIGLSFTEKGKKHPKNGLIYKIVNAIHAGKLKIIKKDKNGNYLTCDGKTINSRSLKHVWKNNKCLMNSNMINY